MGSQLQGEDLATGTVQGKIKWKYSTNSEGNCPGGQERKGVEL